MKQEERRLYLIRELLHELPRYRNIEIAKDHAEQKKLLRSLMNIRMAAPISEAFLQIQDEYLQETVKQKGIADIKDFVQGHLTKGHEELLASCCRSCLEVADENDVENMAFCRISTGVFMFPNERAAEIAVQTVRDYRRKKNSGIEVKFNV